MATFDIVYQSLSNITTNLKQLQVDVKELEKELKHIEKKHCKNKSNYKASGFATPKLISSELCEFMNLPEGSQVARTEVTKFISKYIKTNDLQDIQNKKYIIPDDKLNKLLQVPENVTLTYFNLQKYMNKHYNTSA